MKKSNVRNLELLAGLGLAGAILSGAAFVWKANKGGEPVAAAVPAVDYTQYTGYTLGNGGASMGTVPAFGANVSRYYGLNYPSVVTTAGASGPSGSTATGGTADTVPAFGVNAGRYY